jgi:aspartate/tyrosine/aromatic aminotransferase
MLESLENQPADKIITMIALYAADPRTDKLDLGVGVYKDAQGRTPVMRAVKEAEKRLLADQDTKSYVGILGDLSFVDAMADLALGDAVRAIGCRAPRPRAAPAPSASSASSSSGRTPGPPSGTPTRRGRTTRRSSATSASRRAPTATSTPRPRASTSPG